ncbi:MAG: nucleotide exchange factor GrpE [Candidatus Zixiibacteriota bacterium]|nr:MAG: nucleotide exchange factor GrpE [candidate division Zixibacteria bacterium]
MAKKQHGESGTDRQQPEVDVDRQGEKEPAAGEVEKGEEITPETVSDEQELCEEDRLRQQVDQLEDKLLRTAADFENYKKRITRQYEDMARASSEAILVELLEVVDNFERALNHSEENTDFDSFRKGTELILNQMIRLLEKYDVTAIDAVGKPFDPNLHEAVMQVASDEFEEGMVAMEMTRGYRQGQRVIRHSKVGVSSGKKKQVDE